MPDENTKYPHQFASYSLLSPLYLNQAQQRNSQSCVFVNNAKILATHLIPIDADQYQTLHIIDQVLEFAYVNRRAQLRGGSSMSAGAKKSATVKKALSLDDLQQPTEQLQQQAAYDYYERFADLQANQPPVDLYHTRVYQATDGQHRLALGRDELNLERLARAFRQHPELRSKLYQVNESSSMNTYFLPINTDRLEAILRDGAGSWSRLALEAHVVPDQVLFTRVMGLGQPHATLFDRDSRTHRVSLSLAKTLPDLTSGSSSEQDLTSPEEASRKLLATPLILQATCAPLASGQQQEAASWRSGLTNAELLVANIPLSNGVLHLIKQPILITDSVNILDYLNDNDDQLSQVVSALGSRTTSSEIALTKGAAAAGHLQQAPTRLNRFHELLARERQMLATLQMDGAPANKTILAPSDQAFQRLRFDLRALVQGDESLIPRHWDASYRRDLLERLVKRHVVLQQTITSDMMHSSGGYQALSDNGKLLSFVAQDADEFQVECDGSQARLLHRDLIGSNGVLHIIDRVLGEEQETVYSLLKSILLRHQNRQSATPSGDSEASAHSSEQELSQVIQANLKGLLGQNNNEHMISTSPSNSIAAHADNQQQQQQSPELALISRSIGQYLEEVTNRRQLEQLATSVNISYQLAKLTSLAEGLDDWNEKFKQTDRQFTYFVPSDLAWIRLQQAQPELYKPLMYFLGQQQQQQPGEAVEQSSAMVAGPAGNNEMTGMNSLDSVAAAATTASGPKSPRSSESSHRLRQVTLNPLALASKWHLARLDKFALNGRK